MPARALWLTIGLLALACGVAGVVLPLVPATPFLLVAAYAFARSSPRLHDWLVSHAWLGPPIKDWRAHGAISRRAKFSAMVLMLATLTASYFASVQPALLLAQAAAMAGAAVFILTRPDGPGSKV